MLKFSIKWLGLILSANAILNNKLLMSSFALLLMIYNAKGLIKYRDIDNFNHFDYLSFETVLSFHPNIYTEYFILEIAIRLNPNHH